MNSATTTTEKKHLNTQNYRELVEKRGLSLIWIGSSCYSVTAEEATKRLGYSAKSGGILLEGCNRQIQFKPDKPWLSDKDKEAGVKKAPKYRSPLGEYDATLPSHPTDPYYWDNIEALKQQAYIVDGHPCLVLTEGFFKAIAGCSIDIPTIALLGVEQGLTPSKADIQGKRYLVLTLERYAKAGFGFIIAFDADCATNKAVIYAQRKLAAQIKLFKVPVYIATGLWSVEEGKGMDDYIQNNGADRFKREVLGKVINIESWEQQFKNADDQQELASQDTTAARLAEKYRPELAYHTSIKRWLRYSSKFEGVWSEISDESLKKAVIAETRTKLRHFKDSFINGVVGLLKADLSVEEWDEQPGLLPMKDGVLRLDTQELLPHAPGYRLLWSLPYRWKDRVVGHQPIESWLIEAMRGDRSLVQLIRAYLKCVVTGRVDLHRYLECLGPGGTGKGTLMRLAMDLVGKRNTHSTTLKQLEDNRFEAAAVFGKRLLLITDAERYGGEVSQLKAITGQDLIRYERKNVQQGQDFMPTCMVVVAANEAVQSSDYTSGLERRRLTVPWIHQVKPHERRDLAAEFKPYLPGLLQWVMAMPDEEVNRYIRDTDKNVLSLQTWKAESLIETNPLAEWVDFCLSYQPDARTNVGVAKLDKTPGSFNTYLFTETWLYASYREYSISTGNKAVASRRFTGLLNDLCVNQMKLEGVKKGRDEGGSFFKGLLIRQHGDISPRIITGNLPSANPDGKLAVETPQNYSNLTAETHATDETDGNDGKIESCSTTEFSEKISDDRENFCSQVENPSESIIYRQEQPQPVSQTSNPQEEKEMNLAVGDRVSHADPYESSYVWQGVVVKVELSRAESGTHGVQWDEGENISTSLRWYNRSELRRL